MGGGETRLYLLVRGNETMSTIVGKIVEEKPAKVVVDKDIKDEVKPAKKGKKTTKKGTE